MPRKKKKGDEINTNGWMDTYADTITLLLTFFILLYSISAVDSEKLKQLSESLQNSLNGETKVTEVESLDDLNVEVNENNEETTEYEDLVEKLNQIIQTNGLTEIIKVREEDRGVVLQLDETILFDPGKADLKGNSEEVLSTINTIITETTNDVLIEGHTDDVPMNNREFRSNWELSTARAVSVVKKFVSANENINPTRFTVKGYGEYHPLVPNDSPENRAINRRVDILMIEQKVKKTEDQKAQDNKVSDNQTKATN